jgi:hypothetical protein
MFFEESQQSEVNPQIPAIYDGNLPNHLGRITLRLDSLGGRQGLCLREAGVLLMGGQWQSVAA